MENDNATINLSEKRKINHGVRNENPTVFEWDHSVEKDIHKNRYIVAREGEREDGLSSEDWYTYIFFEYHN